MSIAPQKHPSGWPLTRFAVWLTAGFLAALAVAWLSLQVQKAGFAPVGVLSLLVGVVLGAALLGLLWLLPVASRAARIAGAVLLALVTVGGQHWFAYLDDRASFERVVATNPQAAFALAANDELRPRTLPEYLQLPHHRERYALWAVDALLIVLATTVLVGLVSGRWLYCHQGQTWYRTTRQHALSDAQAAVVTRAADVTLPAGARQIQLRLQNCPSGCGPARMTVSWIDAQRRPAQAQAWLDADAQRRIETAAEA